MANELEIINNPTSTPAAVSTGYQAQNTRMLAASNGIDNTYVEVIDASTVRLAKSGAVDISGTLYAVGEAEDFTVSSAGRYYIYLADGYDAAHKTPTLGTDAGTFDAELNARYLATGERVLNWVIVKSQYGAESLQVMRMVGADNTLGFTEQDCIKGMLLKRVQITNAGTETFTAPRSQVYNFELQAKGGDGGDRYKIGSTTYYCGGGGGGGGGYVRASIFLEAGTVITLTKSVSSGRTNSVTGTGITISAVNGSNGGNASSSPAQGAGGFYGEATVSSGYGFTVDGGHGMAGGVIGNSGGEIILVDDSDGFGIGGNSFMGNPRDWGYYVGGEYNENGYGFGGKGEDWFSDNGFAGGYGLFLIWG